MPSTRSRLRWPCAALLLVAGGGALPTDCCGQDDFLPPTVGETLLVELGAGRVVVGEVDQRTSDEHLWLTRSVAGAHLASGFPWTKVSGWQRLPASAAATSPAEADFESQLPTHAELLPAGDLRHQRHLFAPSHTERSSVVTLQIFAALGQWDRDVAADGLRVLVQPLDRFGHIVPVDGRINLQLWGQYRRWRGGRVDRRQPRFSELERWSRQLHVKDFGPDGAVISLPFRRFHPGRALDVAVESLLHARLSLAGVGVFEAAQADVYLRPLSRWRDDLQQYSGRRYLPQER